ncbi:hypothetical protein LIER_35188 [Lithospermum erythrorhizon]|uniref:Reverse transcriptase n=1 Tax=Lithospermum erythrorhizon TaxID=34254 RepID=A0AAV3NMF8_LITER
MNCRSWNYRGLGHPRTVRALQHLVKTQKPRLVFLIETKLRSSEWDSIKCKIQMGNGLPVDSRDRRGGLALLWPRGASIVVKSYYSHHIKAEVDWQWRLVGFYGHHKVRHRRLSWELLKYVGRRSVLPTVFVRDFNEVTSRAHPEIIKARLDRALAIVSWVDLFEGDSIDLIQQGRMEEDGKMEVLRLSNKIDDLRLVEETYWRQRAGAQWVLQGDQNTKFFHGLASQRRKYNRIKGLGYEDGVWQSEMGKIQDVAVNFYLKLFPPSRVVRFLWGSRVYRADA